MLLGREPEDAAHQERSEEHLKEESYVAQDNQQEQRGKKAVSPALTSFTDEREREERTDPEPC